LAAYPFLLGLLPLAGFSLPLGKRVSISHGEFSTREPHELSALRQSQRNAFGHGVAEGVLVNTATAPGRLQQSPGVLGEHRGRGMPYRVAATAA
jgi:hypothetical protein